MPKKSKLFSSGLYGEKSNGKWGKLTGKEIIEKSLQGEIINPQRFDRSQKEQIKREYEKKRKEVSERVDDLQNYLNETGAHSKAYDDFLTSGNGSTTLEENPDSFEQMLNEYMRGELFTEDETSTPQGVREFYEDFAHEYGGFDEDEEINFREVDTSMKWVYFRRLERYNPNIISDLGGLSAALDQIEAAIIEGFDMDEWCLAIINAYEAEAAERRQNFYRNARPL